MEFKQLPLSTYEVRVECPGWKSVVRRVILSETDKTQALLLKMINGDGETREEQTSLAFPAAGRRLLWFEALCRPRRGTPRCC